MKYLHCSKCKMTFIASDKTANSDNFFEAKCLLYKIFGFENSHIYVGIMIFVEALLYFLDFLFDILKIKANYFFTLSGFIYSWILVITIILYWIYFKRIQKYQPIVKK